MEEPVRVRLKVLTGAFAAVVATIHLLHPSHGGHALVVYAAVGYLGDPRPLLFTLGGFALVFGILLGYNGFDGRPLYLGGIVLTLAFPLGYAAWHTVLDHGAFWPHIEPQVAEEGHPVVVVLEHLLYERLALYSRLAEAGLLAGLVALYLTEPGSEPDPDPAALETDAEPAASAQEPEGPRRRSTGSG